MQEIGEIRRDNPFENELSFNWAIGKAHINSYVSPVTILPVDDKIFDLQFAIVNDQQQNLVKFFIFLYDCEELSGSTITFNACFSKISSTRRLRWSGICLDISPCVKIYEINSSHGMFHDDPNKRLAYHYNFKITIKLSKKSPFPSLSTESNEESTRAINLEYPRELIENFRSLLTSSEMCDLEIRIGEEILRVHKLILCARSPVFKRMMVQACLESTSNSITITDCLASEFKTFLKYLYTAEIEDNTMDTVISLYSLGDKYDVPALREACSNILQSKLSNDSVDDVANTICDVLNLAECHGDTKLKDLTSRFIVNHFALISSKQTWKDLMKSNFELTSQILALLATSFQKVQN